MTADTYITMQGDCWDAIAYRLWGDERLFAPLVAANPDHLDTVVFPAGVELRVPAAPDRTIKTELPPWM